MLITVVYMNAKTAEKNWQQAMCKTKETVEMKFKVI